MLDAHTQSQAHICNPGVLLQKDVTLTQAAYNNVKNLAHGTYDELVDQGIISFQLAAYLQQFIIRSIADLSFLCKTKGLIDSQVQTQIASHLGVK